MKKLLTRLVIPLLVIVGALLIARSLSLFKKAAARDKPEPVVAVVEVFTVMQAQKAAHLRTTGIVEAALQVTLSPEVGGRLRFRSENLVPGGRFKKGEVVARIDGSDYALQIKQQKSSLQQARALLSLEKGRGQIAAEEWKIIGEGRPESQAELALRKPQLDSAKWAMRGAKSSLSRAQLNLSRTVIRAPFDAVVLNEQAEVGQVLAPGTPIATLVGTEKVWVRVSVPVARLAEINIPGVNSELGSKVTVRQRLGPTHMLEREGRVVRLVSQLDPQTRSAQLLVAIADPFKTSPDVRIPLLPGAYVDVDIEGESQIEAFEIPRTALFTGSKVWTVNQDQRLESRKITVLWGSRNSVFVDGKVAPGIRLMVTPLSLPMEGLKVSATEGKDESDAPSKPQPVPAAQPAGSAEARP